MIKIYPLGDNPEIFPDPLKADDEGLLAYGGDLTSQRIINGYYQGIFPWFNEDDPILWWSPNPRFVLDIDDLHISKSLRRTIKKNIFEIKYNQAFVKVLIECASANRPDQDGTWITPDMIEAYSQLHHMGIAHSFEAYYDGELVGGGYGVVVGNIFCGESMFAKKNDASKVAFVNLVTRLKNHGFKLIDSQVYTPHLEHFGAKYISRKDYISLVKKGLKNPKQF